MRGVAYHNGQLASRQTETTLCGAFPHSYLESRSFTETLHSVARLVGDRPAGWKQLSGWQIQIKRRNLSHSEYVFAEQGLQFRQGFLVCVGAVAQRIKFLIEPLPTPKTEKTELKERRKHATCDQIILLSTLESSSADEVYLSNIPLYETCGAQ